MSKLKPLYIPPGNKATPACSTYPRQSAYPCRQAHVTLKQVHGDGLVAAERNASGRHCRRVAFARGYIFYIKVFATLPILR